MGGRTARSRSDGRFSVDRLPNDRALVATASAPGFAFGRSADLPPPFRSDGEEMVVRLVEGGTIVGTVLDAKGDPLDKAQVHALSQGTWRSDGRKPEDLGSQPHGRVAPVRSRATAHGTRTAE